MAVFPCPGGDPGLAVEGQAAGACGDLTGSRPSQGPGAPPRAPTPPSPSLTCKGGSHLWLHSRRHGGAQGRQAQGASSQQDWGTWAAGPRPGEAEGLSSAHRPRRAKAAALPPPHGRQPGLPSPCGSLITGLLSVAEAIPALTTVTAPCSRVLPLLTASATCRCWASLTAPTPHPTTWALGSLARPTQRSLWFPTLHALHPVPPATREDLTPGMGWGVTATGAQRVHQSWAGSPLPLPRAALSLWSWCGELLRGPRPGKGRRRGAGCWLEIRYSGRVGWAVLLCAASPGSVGCGHSGHCGPCWGTCPRTPAQPRLGTGT